MVQVPDPHPQLEVAFEEALQELLQLGGKHVVSIETNALELMMVKRDLATVEMFTVPPIGTFIDQCIHLAFAAGMRFQDKGGCIQWIAGTCECPTDHSQN